MATWGSLLTAAIQRLHRAGVESTVVDAELLAGHVLGVPRGQLLVWRGREAEPGAAGAFDALVERRARREPLQHLVGTAAFRYLELQVGPGVFVPRFETELMVDWALRELSDVPAPLVADLCAGTGAIGLAIRHECPQATVYLVEKNPAALEWLRRNVGDDSATIVEGDATDPEVLPAQRGRCDAVLSNPPYVPAATAVTPEVDADPADAVFAGADGLDVIRPLVPCAAALLRPGGVVAIEHDHTHGKAVPQLLRRAGFEAVTNHADLAGRSRFTTGRKPSHA